MGTDSKAPTWFSEVEDLVPPEDWHADSFGDWIAEVYDTPWDASHFVWEVTDFHVKADCGRATVELDIGDDVPTTMRAVVQMLQACP